MTSEEYLAYQEKVGRHCWIWICPGCGDLDDVEDAEFDEDGNYWGCEWCSPRLKREAA